MADNSVAPLIDLDGDPRGDRKSDIGVDEFGLPSWWQNQYFGHTGIDPNADPLGDGLTNWQAWQQGLDPTHPWSPPDNDPNTFPEITILQPAGATLSLSPTDP